MIDLKKRQWINSLEILDKMQKQKINYDKVLQKMKADWQAKNAQPRILLHSCCAPCSTHTLKNLSEMAQVTVLYANPNIHPANEYRRRLEEQKRFITAFNQRNAQTIGVIETGYEPEKFVQMVREAGLENEPEEGKRCTLCFQLRLTLAAQQAVRGGYDYFASTLTISPMKDAELINRLGLKLQERYGVLYLPSDFKKGGGYQQSIQLSKEYGIYRQHYCGCLFAARQQGIDLKTVNQEAKHYLDQLDSQNTPS